MDSGPAPRGASRNDNVHFESTADARNSASPADADNSVIDPLVLFAHMRTDCRTMRFLRRKSRSLRLYRWSNVDRPIGISRRVRSVTGGRRQSRRRNRRDRRLRQRGNPGRVADAAGIADRVVEPVDVARPRRNAADAGVLRRRSGGRCQQTHRNAHDDRSAAHPSASENRNGQRAAHSRVILFASSRGKETGKPELKFPGCVISRQGPDHPTGLLLTRRANQRAVFARGLSSPFAKNISVLSGCKSPSYPPLSCPERGALAIVTNVGMGCGGRGGAFDEQRQGGRRSRVVLTPRRWRQAGS